MTNYLKSVPMTSPIYEFVHYRLENDPDNIDALVNDLRAFVVDQSKSVNYRADDIRKMVGSDLYDELMKLPEDLIQY